MSLDISILIAGAGSAEDVYAELRTEGVCLVPREIGLWVGAIGGLDVALIAEPGLEDDAGLPLSRFGVQLSFTRYSGDDSELQEVLMDSLGCLLAQRFARRRGWHCLVVRNLQIKRAEYRSDASPNGADEGSP